MNPYQVMTYDQMLQAGGYQKTADQVVDDLRKALQTTSGTPMANGNGPLMLENLDGVMTEALVTEQHFKIYGLLPKVPSSTPYYEYNIHKSFGSNRAGGAGFRQGGAPKGGNSSFERKGIYNKFTGVKRGITHQMLITGQHGGAFEDPTVRENRDGTLELLEKTERELIFGNANIKDESGVEVNYDGLLTQLAEIYPENVIDLQGEPLNFAHLDQAAHDLVTKGKQPSVNGYTVMQSAHVANSLNQMYGDRNIVRHNKDTATGQSYTPGTVVEKYDTQFGTFKFDFSILLQEVEGGQPLFDAAPAGVPATPVINAQPVAADDAAATAKVGTYYYSVGAFNDTGESLPVITDAVVVGDASTKVTIVITKVANATGYRIYRGKLADGTDAKWIAKVPQAVGNLTFVDRGEWCTTDADGNPADGLALLIKPDAKDLCIAQMTPLVKMALPQQDTTFPFLLLLYLVSVIKEPKRLKIYKNCGTYKKPE